MPKRIVYFVRRNEHWVFLAVLGIMVLIQTVVLIVGINLYQDQQKAAREAKVLAARTRVLTRENARLARENKSRIREIQESRQTSCRQIYGSFLEVFRPFFGPPRQRSPEMAKDITKFKRNIVRLQNRCPSQVRTDSDGP